MQIGQTQKQNQGLGTKSRPFFTRRGIENGLHHPILSVAGGKKIVQHSQY